MISGFRSLAQVGLVLLFAQGCGGEEYAPPLNWRMAGVWEGALLVVPGPDGEVATPMSAVDVRVSIVISDEVALVSGFCSDGSGLVILEGSGPTAGWRGVAYCPRESTPACPSGEALEINMMSIEADGFDAIHLNAVGVLRGCGRNVNVAIDMRGGRI